MELKPTQVWKDQITWRGAFTPRRSQMNEAKLSSAVGGKETRPMTEEEIVQLFHSPAVISAAGSGLGER